MVLAALMENVIQALVYAYYQWKSVSVYALPLGVPKTRASALLQKEPDAQSEDDGGIGSAAHAHKNTDDASLMDSTSVTTCRQRRRRQPRYRDEARQWRKPGNYSQSEKYIFIRGLNYYS